MFTSRDIIELLNQLLREKGWSINRLSTQADISQSTMNSMFHSNKEYYPSLPTLCKVCSALGLSVSKFLAMVEEEDPMDLSFEEYRIVQEVQRLRPKQKKKLLEFLEVLNVSDDADEPETPTSDLGRRR